MSTTDILQRQKRQKNKKLLLKVLKRLGASSEQTQALITKADNATNEEELNLVLKEIDNLVALKGVKWQPKADT